MEWQTEGKSREHRLKVAALAWGCTLTPPTAVQPPEPPSPDGSCSFFLTQYVYRFGWFLTRNAVVTLSSFPRWKREFGRKSEKSTE